MTIPDTPHSELSFGAILVPDACDSWSLVMGMFMKSVEVRISTLYTSIH